jgi:hypothetical protein
MSNRLLSDDQDLQLELQMRLSPVGDGRRPLAGATNGGKLPKTRTAGSPANGRWVDGIVKSS